MSSSNIQGKIPVSPENLQYIQYVEGLSQHEALTIPRRTPVGESVLALINLGMDILNRPRASAEFVHRDKSLERFEASLLIELSGPVANYDVFQVMGNVAYHFNEIIPSLVIQHVQAQFELGRVFKLSEVDVIEMFLESSGLIKYWDVERLHKAMYRARSARKQAPLICMRGRRNLLIPAYQRG